MNDFEVRARKVARRAADALGPSRSEVEVLEQRVAELYALQERNSRAIDTLNARMDRVVEDLRAEFGDVVANSGAVQRLVSSLVGPGDELQLAAALDARVRSVVDATAGGQRLSELDQALRDLTFAVRTLQASPGRAAAAPSGDGPPAAPAPGTAPAPAAPARTFQHPAPVFDDLYRAFEDRHRGARETIAARLAEDYVELLDGLPSPELKVADLGCGRGELVAELQRAGVAAVGVDNNVGQLVGTDADQFVEADLFDWLDAQEDGSLRAVVGAHVVEHLPLDLQVRLVFEARRVVAPGGLLVLETPNTLSLSIGATNFWVDPTHERPVHPLFLEFLATSAGFGDVSTRLLHDVGVGLRSTGDDPELVEDLNSLLFGPGDVALIARR